MNPFINDPEAMEAFGKTMMSPDAIAEPLFLNAPEFKTEVGRILQEIETYTVMEFGKLAKDRFTKDYPGTKVTPFVSPETQALLGLRHLICGAKVIDELIQKRDAEIADLMKP